jgi:hypothetical protein
MAEVRPALPQDFEAVYPLLQEFPQPQIPKEHWRRMLFDPPWPVEEPHRGYMLVDGSQVVGFMGAMFSRRWVRGVRIPFCNLSSWIVRPTHRAQSLELLRPVLALKDYTVISPSPNAVAHPLYLRLGFTVLENTQWLMAPLAWPNQLLRATGTSLVTDPERIRGRLDSAGREIHESLRGTVAAEALVLRRGSQCHVVATASSWKGRWRLAHVQYASDWGMFWDHAPQVAGAFFRTLGTVGLRVDSRHAAGQHPAFAVRRAMALPTLYLPGAAGTPPHLVDGLYSETLFHRF